MLSRKMSGLTLEEERNIILPVLNEMLETSDEEKSEKLRHTIYSNIQRYCSVRDDVGDKVEIRREWTIYTNILYYLGLHRPEPKVYITINVRKWRLYLQLQDFLTTFCNRLVEKSARLSGEDLLRFNVTEWKKYGSKQRSLNWAFGLLTKNCEGAPRMFKIGVLALISWKETLFERYNQRIVQTAVNLINFERQDIIIDSTLISGLTDYYLALGIHVDGENDSLCVYKNHFERILLEETETFYVKFSTMFLQSHSVLEYLEEIEKRFAVEKQRVDVYFHSSTKEAWMKTLKSSLIERYLKVFFSEFKKLLTLDETDDIGRTYSSFLSKHTEYLSKFAKVFEEHVLGQGLAYIEGCGKDIKTDPKMYTDAVLVTYKKYLNMVKYVFFDNKCLMNALQNATKQFVNKNFANLPPNTARKTTQLVCKYYDGVMRKKLFALNAVSEKPVMVAPSHLEVLKYGNCTMQIKQLVDALDDILVVFSFIEDKDVFYEYHMQSLAKRLVNDISSNDLDLESNTIIKMKSIAAAQYAEKLEKMIGDMKLSIALNEEFGKTLREPLEVEFKVKVLQFGLWPFKVTEPYTLPIELEKCVAQFSKFYSGKHLKKRLCWLYDLSKGEIVTTNYKNSYTIHANTMQISILLLFNNSTSWTLAEIQEETNIGIDLILEIIAIFLKIKLLTCESSDNLTQNSKICLNQFYNNKKRHIQIDVPLKSETSKKQQEVLDANIDKARILILQAAIVRIMKSRKTIQKVDLFQQVLHDLVSQFHPDIGTIQKCIETLIEKEYIQRSSTEANTFIYVP